LKPRTTCGLRPCSRQIRRTVEALTSEAFAMSRVLHCVALGGVSCVVMRTMSATFLAPMVFGRPRPGASFSMPAMRSLANRLRQRPTVFWSVPKSSAISLFCLPFAACSTIFARSTSRAGVDRPRA
jgi:hypothetical protein